MKQSLTELKKLAFSAIDVSDSLRELGSVRLAFLGKKGRVTHQLKALSNLSSEERPKAGQAINQLKQAIQDKIQSKKHSLEQKLISEKLASERIDVSLPGRKAASTGSLHPVSSVRLRIENYFSTLGFDIVSGPEIETDYYNFKALNFPLGHPARTMHDTFYLESSLLLRTHTSPVQIRVMGSKPPPFRLIAPGRVYRCDFDLTHTPMFHQIEGLMVDQNSTFAHLKGILKDFLDYFFEKEVTLRFRPSYFPFTEPSVEVDVQCIYCQKNELCRICKGSTWLEVLGAGMVHPNVLHSVDIDPDEYSGWAFGMGIDRLAMLRYNIQDLRTLFENDQRFLEQF